MFKGYCIINRETTDEVAKVMSTSVKKFYLAIVAAVFAILTALFVIDAKNSNMETNIVMLLINALVICFLVWIARRNLKSVSKKIAHRLMDQMSTAYHTDSLTKEMIFEGNKMNVETEPEVYREYWLSDVEKLSETENHIVFRMKGNMYLWTEKATVEGGTYEEFMAYLKQYISKK